MGLKNLIFKEFADTKESYPKLEKLQLNSIGLWEFYGDYDVIDSNGYCWDTYRIRIIFPKLYPLEIPIIEEISNKVEKSIDWHNPNGFCCTGTYAQIHHVIGHPFSLKKWMQIFVHSFFANHIVRLKEGVYPIGEYSHYGKGVLESYFEIFNTDSSDVVLNKLFDIQSLRNNSKNSICKCGSGKKHKRCFLKYPKEHTYNIPYFQIVKDRKVIQKI